MSLDDITSRFRYHPADTEEKKVAHEEIRGESAYVAHLYDGWLPEGREKALALTKLEEAMFWANAAIARQS